MIRIIYFCFNARLVVQITQGGLLEETLCDLQDKSEQAFLVSLQQQVNNMLVRVEAPPRDLSPTPAINHLLAILRDMLSTASMNEGREVDMGKVNRYHVNVIFLYRIIFFSLIFGSE